MYVADLKAGILVLESCNNSVTAPDVIADFEVIDENSDSEQNNRISKFQEELEWKNGIKLIKEKRGYCTHPNFELYDL